MINLLSNVINLLTQEASEGSEATEEQILTAINRIFRTTWCSQSEEFVHLPDLSEAVLEDPSGAYFLALSKSKK